MLERFKKQAIGAAFQNSTKLAKADAGPGELYGGGRQGQREMLVI